MLFRKLTTHDAKALSDLEDRLRPSPACGDIQDQPDDGQRYWSKRLKKHLGYGLFEDDTLIASLILKEKRKALVMDDVLVDPAQQDQGFGQSLVNTACEEVALDGEHDLIRLKVDPHNVPAVKIYANAGFQFRKGKPNQMQCWPADYIELDAA